MANKFTDEELANEVWLPVPIFTNYEASSLGRIRNTYTGHILKPFKGYGKNGRYYQKVTLCKDGLRCAQFVHRLVAFAFYEIDHKNGVRDDNRLSNLEPVERKENDARWRERMNKYDTEVPF